MTMAVILTAAFLLDALFGDPAWISHPICLIGSLISRGEKLLRKRSCTTPKEQVRCGALLTVCCVVVCFLVPFGILWLLGKIHWGLALAAEIWFCFQIFAAHSLKKESMKVMYPLEKGDLPQARKYLSYIVGRDTQELTGEGVAKGAVETVAENTTDGVIAPLFYMAIGGAPLAFAYKAVNTLDSMIGYKNDQYLYFGRFAAKNDDVWNYIPARLSAFLMILSAFLLGYDGKGAIRIYRRDRRKHASPNSAQTESVCAGALGLRLAGDASYFGKIHHKPTIGDPVRPIEAKDIARANRLMYATSVLGVILAAGIHLALWYFLFR